MSEFPYEQIYSTDIERLGFKWGMLDDIDHILSTHNKGLFTFLLNLDYNGNSGTHWTTVTIDNDNKYIYYFDPLGNKNDNKYGHNDQIEARTSVPRELYQASKKYGYKNVWTNPFNTQFLKSWMCGYFALYIASIMRKYQTMSPKQFEEIITGELGIKPDRDIVEKVLKWWKSVN